jgi:ribosomal protein S18 acetylase RimI-like enzyme
LDKNQIYHGIPYDDEILENKIASANEHIFPCAKFEGKIVGYMKIGFDQVYIKNFEKAYRFKAGIGFIYAAYVDSQYRNYGIYTFLRTEATNMLSEKGMKKIVGYVRSSNISAIKASLKCGSNVTHSNRQLKCFCLNFFGKLPERYLSV